MEIHEKNDVVKVKERRIAERKRKREREWEKKKKIEDFIWWIRLDVSRRSFVAPCPYYISHRSWWGNGAVSSSFTWHFLFNRNDPIVPCPPFNIPRSHVKLLNSHSLLSIVVIIIHFFALRKFPSSRIDRRYVRSSSIRWSESNRFKWVRGVYNLLSC